MAADLNKIEGQLNNIESNSSILVGKMNSDLLSIINAIQSLDNNISSKKTSKKSATVNPSGITSMLKVVSSINPQLRTFSSNITDVNTGLKTLSQTLLSFSNNIQGIGVNSQSSDKSSRAKNSNQGEKEFGTVKDTLDDIKKILKDFHDDFRKQQPTTGNEELDKKIARQNKKEEEEKLEYRKARYAYIHGNATEKQKKLLKEHKKQQKRADDLDGKGPKPGTEIAKTVVGGISSFATGNISAEGILSGIGGMLGKLSGPLGLIFQLGKSFADIVDKEQKFGRDYTRAYGGGRAGRSDFIRQSANFRLAMPIKYGFTNEEYFKAAQSLTDMTGRAAYRRSNSDFKSAIGLSRMGIEGEALGMFDTFGRSIQSTDDYFNKLYGKAGKSGLSFKKMTDAIKNNLKLAQTYTFNKGVDGLQKMAETSTRLKYNMSEAAKFAEQVNTVEGAMKAAANLSVLGGEFSQFGNPMGMLYESLNDMEGLNDRMVKLFSNMAYWDENKGQIDVRAQDRVRIREASKAMGVDANEMLNIAMNSRREKMIEGQLRSLNVDDETAGYIKNLAQINKKGQAYISDTKGVLGKAGEEILLSNPNFQRLIPGLKAESEAKSNRENGSIGDVFVETRTIYDFMEQNLKGLSGKVQALVAKFVTKGPAMSASQKGYWKEVKGDDEKLDELIKRYGSRHRARQAIRRGDENENIEQYVGGSVNRDYIDSKEWSGYTKRDIVSKAHEEGKTMSEAEQWRKDKNKNIKHHNGLSISENEYTATLMRGESVLNAGATRRLGVSNIKALNYGSDPFNNKVSNMSNKMDNILNTMKVAPRQVSSIPSKISFEPITVNIGGKFDLVDNGRNKTITFNDIDTRALKKVIIDAVTENIPAIMRKAGVLNNKGYDKEHDPYRGTFSQVL